MELPSSSSSSSSPAPHSPSSRSVNKRKASSSSSSYGSASPSSSPSAAKRPREADKPQPRTWYFINAEDPKHGSAWASGIPKQLEPVFRMIQGEVREFCWEECGGLTACNLLRALAAGIGEYVKLGNADGLFTEEDVEDMETVLSGLEQHFQSRGEEWDRKCLEQLSSNSADHLSLLNFDKRGVYQFFVFQ